MGVYRGRDEEASEILYPQLFFFIELIFVIPIPCVVFCGRKHFPLFSSEAASSLDSGGSLEGASLPAENKAKDQL